MPLSPSNFTDKQIEQAYIGSVMMYGGKAVYPPLEPTDFFYGDTEKIYKHIIYKIRLGEPIDALAVCREIKISLPDLNQMIDLATAPDISRDVYGKKIKTLSQKRQLHAVMVEALDKLGEVDSITDWVDNTNNEVGKIFSFNDLEKMQHLGPNAILSPADAMRAYADHINKLESGGLAYTYIPDIDQHIRCIAGGEVMTVMARPGCFKTAFLQHIMLNFSKKNEDKLALFFSLEMPVQAIYERFSQKILGYTGSEVEAAWRQGMITREEIAKIEAEMSNIRFVTIRPSIKQMSSFIRMAERTCKKPVGLIGIDYLGLVSDPGKSEYERNSKIATDCKTLAKTHSVPVVLLSQINREGDNGTTPVSLSMGRGSGQIEEAADFILGFNQQPSKSIPCGFYINCRILKNRKGRNNIDIDLFVNPELMEFR